MSNPNPARSHSGRQRDQRRGLVAGTIAALVGVACVVVLRALSGLISILDVLADLTLSLLPLPLFAALLRLFGVSAKAWLLAGLIAALIVAGALTGRHFAGATAGSRRVLWGRGLFTAAFSFAPLAVLFLWATGFRFPGVLTRLESIVALLLLAVAVIVFGLTLALALALLRRTDPVPDHTPTSIATPALSRRRLVTQAGLAMTALAAVAVLGREIGRVRGSERVAAGAPGEPPEPITPIDQFYVVSKNLIDPREPEPDWTLRIDGFVERELTLTAVDLRDLAGSTPDFVSTLTCISNPVGGPLISTARWTGLPLATLLERAGVRPEAIAIVGHARDGYTDSIPLAEALDPTTAVIWGMNGQPLPAAHGAPVRLIVPGLYGIKNVKWLERLSVVDSEHRGYWQRRGWTQSARVKTSSRIDSPAPRGIVPVDRAGLAGIAFGGDRGISRVEVSTNRGATWSAATIEANPSKLGLSWVIWRQAWTPAPGTYTLTVRATDGTGELQTAGSAPTLPDGASGWPEITAGIA
jgi:DMSO/TMAO reductase YedYZ molybdopterin-dependent catalytic subunit